MLTGIRHPARTLTLLAVTLMTAACGAQGQGGTSDSPGTGPVTVRLATVPIAGAAVPFIARDAGIFDRENLSLDAEFLRFTPDIVASTVGGSSDFGIINTVTLLQAAENNVPVKIISPGYFSNPPEQGLYVTAGSSVESIAGLGGLRVGVVGLQNIQQLSLMALADDAGVDPASIKFVETPIPNMAAALESGQIDAAAMAEPFITLAGDSLTEIVDDVYAPLSVAGVSPIIGYYFTSESYADTNRDVVDRLQTVLLEGQALANEDPDSIRSAIATYSEIEPETLARMGLPGFGTSFAQPSFARAAELAQRYGFIEDVPDLDALFLD